MTLDISKGIQPLSYRSIRLLIKEQSKTRISDRAIYTFMDHSEKFMILTIKEAKKELDKENQIRKDAGLRQRKTMSSFDFEKIFKNFFLKMEVKDENE